MSLNNKFLAIIGAVVAAQSALGQTAGVSVVSRERVLIDQRWDDAVAADTAAAAFLAPYNHVVDSMMSPVVGRAEVAMAANRPESALSNLLADILVWAAKDYGERPVMGVYNMGGIRASLPQGDITFGDVLAVAPFENKICFLTLTGEALLQLFGNMAAVGGEGVSRGVELVIGRDGSLVSARLHGRRIRPKARYRIATIDYLAEGNDRMEAFKLKTDLNAPRDKTNDTRFIIANYLRQRAERGETVAAGIEGRIRIVDENSGGQAQ